MAHIGFLFIMAGLAATGGAIEGKGDMVCAVAMIIEGAWLMWLFREEDDGEKEDDSDAPCGGSSVDKHAGEGTGGFGADTAGGRGAGIPDADNGVSPRDGDCDRSASQTGDLCGPQGMGR